MFKTSNITNQKTSSTGPTPNLFSGLASVSVHGGRVHGLEKNNDFFSGLVVSIQPKEHMQMTGVIDIKIVHLIDINW